MEAEERPRKLRKLEHELQDRDAESAHPQPVVPALETQSSHEFTVETPSKPTQETADTTELFNRLFASVANGEPLTDIPPGLSKNQVKKLRKKAEWEAGRPDRRLLRREKMKVRKVRKRERKQEEVKQNPPTAEELQKPWRPWRPVHLPITFIIDCGFDGLMVDKERISLGSQLTRAYSDNSRASFQVNLMVCSWGGLLMKRFDTVMDQHYRNWKGVTFVDQDPAEAAEMAKEVMSGKTGRKFKMAGAFQQYTQPSTSNEVLKDASEQELHEQSSDHVHDAEDEPNGKPLDGDGVDSSNLAAEAATNTTHQPSNHLEALPADLPPSEVIYLTSDSPHTLTTLNPYSTYVIGGLVDKNRHKGICYKTAISWGIKTAKLPIGEYMEMQSRFVLATNHVVEIMLKWLEHGDWGRAFVEVMPKRKGGKLKTQEGMTGEAPEVDEEDGVDAGDDGANQEEEPDDGGYESGGSSEGEGVPISHQSPGQLLS